MSLKSFSPWNSYQNCSYFSYFSSFLSISSFSLPNSCSSFLISRYPTTSENFISFPKSMASSATEARNT